MPGFRCKRCGQSLLHSQVQASTPPRGFWVTFKDGRFGFDCPAGPGGHLPATQTDVPVSAERIEWERAVLQHILEHAPADRPDGDGAFIGVVDLVDVHRCSALNVTREILCCDSPWAQQPYDERHGGRRVADLWHLEVAGPRPLPEPIPARGMLGLWTPTAEHLEQLQAVTR